MLRRFRGLLLKEKPILFFQNVKCEYCSHHEHVAEKLPCVMCMHEIRKHFNMQYDRFGHLVYPGHTQLSKD